MLNEERITILMGLSGAMVPAGMRKIISWLIRNRYIDVLVSTGANHFHDIHEAMGFRHYLGSELPMTTTSSKRELTGFTMFLPARRSLTESITLADITSELDGIMSSRQFIEEIAKRA